MKKLIVILIAAISFSAASAQSRNDSYQMQDRRQVTQRDNRNYNDQHRSNDNAYNNNNDYAYNNNNGRNDDRNRQEQYGHNRQYDQRIDGYRNDRSFSPYDRDRKIKEAEQERQQKPRSFGTGAIVGGVAGFLLGVLVSH